MKTAIVAIKSTSIWASAAIVGIYDGAPNQEQFGGESKDPDLCRHVEIPVGYDPRAIKAAVYFDRWTYNEELVYEDPEDESAVHESGVFIVLSEDLALKAELVKADVKAVVIKARGFGSDLVDTFAAENVMLGITQAGKTGEVLDKMAPVISALTSGSLYEAITRAKAIPEQDKDLVFITDERLLAAVNKIEAYLGIPLSEEL